MLSYNNLVAGGSSASHKDSNSKFTTGHLNTDSQNNTVLLSTVVVSVRNGSDKPIRMRALLDSGSQASFITANMAKARQEVIKPRLGHLVQHRPKRLVESCRPQSMIQ